MPYSPDYFLTRESWRDWRIEARELIRFARVTRSARVLEIGCGGGGLLRRLRERGAIAVGVDTLEIALTLARKRRGESATRLYYDSLHIVHIAHDNHLPFANNSFDAIIGQHVIEHIADTDAALREWKRVLQPGGRLALATPNVRYPDPAHFADANHAHIFSPNGLRDALTRGGWRVEECATIFPLLARTRAGRGLGILAYEMFQHAPYFSSRGRTILTSARV